MFHVDVHKHTKKYYSTRSMFFGKKLQFVHVIGFYLYSFTFTVLVPWIFFNYLNIMQCIQVALSIERWLLSSRAQQTPLCKLQGIADGHIPLSKRQYKQVCYWQPMVHQNHPTIKYKRSKIHNTYSYCPLTCQKKFGGKWTWRADMKQQNITLKQNNVCVCEFVGVSLES